jgi:hypothetical protein
MKYIRDLIAACRLKSLVTVETVIDKLDIVAASRVDAVRVKTHFSAVGNPMINTASMMKPD